MQRCHDDDKKTKNPPATLTHQLQGQLLDAVMLPWSRGSIAKTAHTHWLFAGAPVVEALKGLIDGTLHAGVVDRDSGWQNGRRPNIRPRERTNGGIASRTPASHTWRRRDEETADQTLAHAAAIEHRYYFLSVCARYAHGTSASIGVVRMGE